MELLVRYAEALGAERFVDTRNVAGVPGSRIRSCRTTTRTRAPTGATRSSRTSISIPTSSSTCPTRSCPPITCRAAPIRRHWQTLGVKVEVFRNYQEREAFAGAARRRHPQDLHAVSRRQRPGRGEHLAWMESSAVIYANSVLGARTNTEGRESTSAAMLTGKIPDWGLHRDRASLRHASHRRRGPGRLGDGLGHARLLRRRRRAGAHPGGRRATTAPRDRPAQTLRRGGLELGGVEMYHIVGVTPEAETLEMAFGPKKPVETFEIRQGRAAPRIRSPQCQRAAIRTSTT